MTARQSKIEFYYHGAAQAVSVAGSFNNWDPNANPLKREAGDIWSTVVKLPMGRHEYRLVVDGHWITDPSCKQYAPNPHGSNNSLLVI